jgi:hypothetical protein
MSKIQSDLDGMKLRLEKALKERNRVKEEWSMKLQRLHDKIRDLEAKWKAEVEAHTILRLDNEDTVKQVNNNKAKLERFMELQRSYKENATKVREER